MYARPGEGSIGPPLSMPSPRQSSQIHPKAETQGSLRFRTVNFASEVHPEFIHDECWGSLIATPRKTPGRPPLRDEWVDEKRRVLESGGPFTIPRLTLACEPGTLALVRIEC